MFPVAQHRTHDRCYVQIETVQGIETVGRALRPDVAAILHDHNGPGTLGASLPGVPILLHNADRADDVASGQSCFCNSEQACCDQQQVDLEKEVLLR